jgi:hypothetical protein
MCSDCRLPRGPLPSRSAICCDLRFSSVLSSLTLRAGGEQVEVCVRSLGAMGKMTVIRHNEIARGLCSRGLQPQDGRTHLASRSFLARFSVMTWSAKVLRSVFISSSNSITRCDARLTHENKSC